MRATEPREAADFAARRGQSLSKGPAGRTPTGSGTEDQGRRALLPHPLLGLAAWEPEDAEEDSNLP